MSFWKKLFSLDAIQGECVPRAFFNATAWAIKKKCPVWIIDYKGHWQACGQNEDGELVFLKGNGWDVWEGKKEGTNPIYKLRTLQNAMEHFIKHNPWATVSDEEQARLDATVKEKFGTDPKEVDALNLQPPAMPGWMKTWTEN